MLELAAFRHLGHPQEVKTNNGLGYITQTTQAFLEKWGIRHNMHKIQHKILQVKQLLKDLTRLLKYY